MRIREPLTHWGNFTVPELKEILKHCQALERLGIAQDEEMMRDITRDITLREERSGKTYVLPAVKTPQHAKQPPQQEELLAPA
jgi:hypothetical protein